MYNWRKMTEEEREYARQLRRARNCPPHSPPHFDFEGEQQYIVTASPERMIDCEQAVLAACHQHSTEIYAWCILPNHYHLLLKTAQIKALRQALGLMHGRLSFQ